MGSCAKSSGNSNERRGRPLQFAYGVPFFLTTTPGYSCLRFAIDESVRIRSWCPMIVQEPRLEVAVGGPCSDCGAMVDRRIACVDTFTHSNVNLCGSCWHAFRQRQTFASGCCG